MIVLSGMAYSYSSRADVMPRLTLDWGRVYEKGASLLTMKRTTELPPPEVTRQLGRLPPLGGSWFSFAPRTSLLARDWSAAKHLAGGQLLLTDAMRLTRSSRMVVSRLRFSEPGTRIIPFAQVAFGQWRVDNELMPRTAPDTELAAQGGVGIDLRVTRAWQLAAETDFTIIYRERNEAGHATAPRMWSTMLASRIEF